MSSGEAADDAEDLEHHEIFCGIPGASECLCGQSFRFICEEWDKHPMIMP
jgi:hypothetical protein